MARSRNIKPAFFAHDVLAECTAHARLLYIGLWCCADRRGVLEDRPKRIKGVLFPFEDVRIDELLNELYAQGFIVRYTTEGHNCIWIPGFCRHQKPHKDEPENSLPSWDESSAQPVPLQCATSAQPVPLSLIADRGMLNEERGIPISPTSRANGRKPGYSVAFENWWQTYPKRVGKGRAWTAYQKATKALAGRMTAPDGFLLEVTSKWAKSPSVTTSPDQFIPHPSTWLNDARYDDDPETWARTREAGRADDYTPIDLEGL